MSTSTLQWRRRERTRTIAAGTVALVGTVGILSAVSRPLRGRLAIVLELLPFHVPRAAATTLVLVSFALLLTARGLRRGQRLAWAGTLALLVASALLNLVKGLDLEEAVIAIGAAGWLATRRAAFPVLPTRTAVRAAVVVGVGGGAAAVLLGVGLSQATGRRHHPRLGESLHAVADRLGGNSILPMPGVGHFVTPMLIAAGIGLVGATLWVLFSPRPGRHLTGAAHLAERERARALVARHGSGSLDYFALRDDKDWFFSGQSLVAHAVRRGVCLVSPDPIGPVDERAEVWADFAAYAERNGWSLAVVGAAQEWLAVYETSGLRPVYLGDEAVVECASFSLEGRSMKSLRGAYGRVRRAGFTAEFLDPRLLDDGTRHDLDRLLDQSRRGDAERGFSMTLSRLFDPADAGLLLTVVRDDAGVPQAFIQWVPAAGIGGWSLDVMRRATDPHLPNGLTDFAIIETIQHLAAGGGGGLALNFAVLRGVLAGESRAARDRFSRAALQRLTGRSQVASLWRFNAKYDPRWVPRYLVLDSVEFLAAQGAAVADAEGLAALPATRG